MLDRGFFLSFTEEFIALGQLLCERQGKESPHLRGPSLDIMVGDNLQLTLEKNEFCAITTWRSQELRTIVRVVGGKVLQYNEEALFHFLPELRRATLLERLSDV